MNDALGAYRKMRRIHDAFPMALASSRVRAADQFGVEQSGERQTTEAVGGLAEKGAAIDVQFELLGVECRLHTVRRSTSLMQRLMLKRKSFFETGSLASW